MTRTNSPLSRRALLAGAAAAAALAAPGVLRAQPSETWPNQPVRMILPYAPGGPTDVIARLVCDTLSQRLPQRFVVENRTGAGGNIGASAVAKARPDGGTVTLSFATNRRRNTCRRAPPRCSWQSHSQSRCRSRAAE